MKDPKIQKHIVTRRDGTKVIACCGPSVAAMTGVTGFEPVGAARRGVCCHRGKVREQYERAERQEQMIREFLGRCMTAKPMLHRA